MYKKIKNRMKSANVSEIIFIHLIFIHANYFDKVVLSKSFNINFAGFNDIFL